MKRNNALLNVAWLKRGGRLVVRLVALLLTLSVISQCGNFRDACASVGAYYNSACPNYIPGFTSQSVQQMASQGSSGMGANPYFNGGAGVGGL